jgi:hypothetical protein
MGGRRFFLTGLTGYWGINRIGGKGGSWQKKGEGDFGLRNRVTARSRHSLGG